MNKKLLVIYKALENVPVDVRHLIVKEVKHQEGTFISESLRKIYYNKVCKNTEIFKILCKRSVYFSKFFEEEVLTFLVYTKNNLTFSYIIDTFLWIDKFIDIHNYYINKNNDITQICDFILERILLKNIYCANFNL
jgi:hypothetical protein|tara:strand:- start:1071 stop:1478 length:408 start_codon:yes stop_codon:yes gene_type:complete